MRSAVQTYIFLWRISRRIAVPRETMGKKTKLFVTCNATKLLSSTTLQSICGFFHRSHFSFAHRWERDLESYSLSCCHPFPSWRDKSLNNDQGRSNMLQLLCSEKAKGASHRERQSRASHTSWHLGVTGGQEGEICDYWFTDSLQRCCQQPIDPLTVLLWMLNANHAITLRMRNVWEQFLTLEHRAKYGKYGKQQLHWHHRRPFTAVN